MHLKSNVEIFPIPNGQVPPYRGIVHYGKNKRRELHLDQLDQDELETFWNMSNAEQKKFIEAHCNHHHREPRARNGKTTYANTPIVLQARAHEIYNQLVIVARRMFKLRDDKDVSPEHIAEAANIFYDFSDAFFHNKVTGKMRTKDEVAYLLSRAWLPENAPCRIRGVQEKPGQREFVIVRKQQ